jgi:hypothetical protein
MALDDVLKVIQRTKGGTGSGNFGHAGVKGKRGGSAARSGSVVASRQSGPPPPQRPVDTTPLKRIESAADIVKTTIEEGTMISAQYQIDRTLKKIPAWHLNGQRVELEVKAKTDVNADFEKAAKSVLGRGAEIAGFAELNTGRIVVAGNNVLTGAQHATAHEIGHIVLDGTQSSKSNRRIQAAWDKLSNTYVARVGTEGRDTMKAVTPYARTSGMEFRAEAYGWYVSSPNHLKAKDPEVYGIIDELFK